MIEMAENVVRGPSGGVYMNITCVRIRRLGLAVGKAVWIRLDKTGEKVVRLLSSGVYVSSTCVRLALG